MSRLITSHILFYVFAQTYYYRLCKLKDLMLNVQTVCLWKNNGKRKVQGVPQSQTAALPRPQEKTKPNKRKSNKRTKSTKLSFLFHKRGNRNAKMTEKKIT